MIGALGAGDVAFERFAASAGGVLGAECLEAAVDLGSDEFGVLEQSSDLVPDQSVELVGADRAAVADPPADVAVVVRADAAVVVDPLVGRAGCAAVAAVAALAADEDALQQRRLLGVALREVRVVRQAGLRELERLLADDRRDRDQRPVLRRLVLSRRAAAVPLAARAGGARRLAVPLQRLGLPERRLPVVGGVAQHPPHARAIPHRLPGPSRHAALRQPPSELADRHTVVDIAIEHLAHDLRLDLVDLPETVAVLGLLHIPVAVGCARQHRLVAGTGAVQLAAAGALPDLRPLVLSDHPLELAQQLVLGRHAPLGLLGEAHLHPDTLELFEQQHLVGVAARETIRRVAQQHLERSLSATVTQPLQRRACQRRAREPLVLEHQTLRNEQPALRGELTQPDGLALDRLVLALALRGHPRVDRRHPAGRSLGSRDLVAHHPSARCLSLGAARAPRSRTPAPAEHRRAGQTRTRSQRVLPPCRSLT